MEQLEKLMRSLFDAVSKLREEIQSNDQRWSAILDQTPVDYRASAQNFLHYLVLRQHDIRKLQTDLASVGLSSLGRCEAHVMATLDSVVKVLSRLTHEDAAIPVSNAGYVHPVEARRRLERHAETLLGLRHKYRPTRIMVTMPPEAASNYELVRDLLAAGMDVMRINCAHDDPKAWTAMVQHLRRAEAELHRICRILADIAGPKLRTGPLPSRPGILRWKPKRNERGEVIVPAEIWLTSERAPLPPDNPAAAVLLVPEDWLSRLRIGDKIEVQELRGKTRKLTIVEKLGRSRRAEALETAYVEQGSQLRAFRDDELLSESAVGALPPSQVAIVVQTGDMLVVSCGEISAEQPSSTAARLQISCLEALLPRFVQPGERIFFDDGKIGGVIRAVFADRFEVEITTAAERGSKLRADKGINLPDSRLAFPALSQKDLNDLDFVAQHADMVGLSFIENAGHLDVVSDELAKRGRVDVGMVLKIETRRAFENLPKLLLAALRHMPTGVMVARGDLGVELGFERLAEVQEEILWLCEAAHVPVIWATQVLESMAKGGQPSRAEVTDAAMSQRAECVMLNKGPFIVPTVRFLSDVLERMQAHQHKKHAMLRKLAVSVIS